MSQWAQPITDYFSKKGWKVLPFILDGCTVIAPSNVFKKNCIKRSEWVLRQVQENNYDLVIGATYPGSTSNYIDKIIGGSKKTILLTQFPKVTNPATCIADDFTYPQSCSKIVSWEISSYRSFNAFLKSKASTKTLILDTTSWTCIELVCPIVSGDMFINRDGSHLTYTFIRSITPLIHATLDSISDW
jgi:hypothetical protein